MQSDFVDKGYRGHGYAGTATIHICGSSSRSLTRTRRHRRSAIEPKISHLKPDHRLGRCFLRGLPGDALNSINTILAADSILRILLRRLFSVPALLRWLVVLTPRSPAATSKAQSQVSRKRPTNSHQQL